MLKKTKQIILTLMTTLTIFGATHAADNAKNDAHYKEQKAVYQVDSNDIAIQTLALHNMQNHINAVGKENLKLVMVLNGGGVSMLLKPESLQKTTMKSANANEKIQAEVKKLREQGVVFQVCRNTLKNNNIDREQDLFEVQEKDVIPSGVAEIAHLQSLGYAYIKP